MGLLPPPNRVTLAQVGGDRDFPPDFTNRVSSNLEGRFMFNPTEVVINAFEKQLRQAYHHTYTNLEPDYPGIIAYVANMALELIANSDAPYHDLNHTLNVTLVGQEIIKGKHLCEGGVTPRDWLHTIISLLCHDIGYVRGICRGDRSGKYVINENQDGVSLAPGATDATLTPHHVERGKIFVQERFANNPTIDVATVCANIEYTQFPVPEKYTVSTTEGFPELVRAADLIGQLGDPNYMRKISALFKEFEETGINVKLGFANPGELRAGYPKFFWSMVEPHIGEALRYLRMTQSGQQFIANLYAHVFAEEHFLPSLGPERIMC